jgi:hypothetical protein
MGNKRVETIVNDNVLDELTITERENSNSNDGDMSKFSESLL